ncbi:MAG: hypothetical protein OXU61_03885, partial [Gammaproteobacteria bacterium]|nr:hypothetical protein [Gammaproteobacteria bacterium]
MAAATPDDTDGPDRFSDTQLATMLGMSNVTVATSAASTGDEDIVVSDDFDLNWTAANSLTLDAGRDILLSGSISGGTMGTLALNFGGTLNFGGATLKAMIVSATGGSTGAQTIVGSSGGSTWAVTGAGAGTLTVETQGVSFSEVENLQGGAGADAFTVSAAHTGDLMGGGGKDNFNLGATLTGSLSGGAGEDTFNLNTGGSVSGGISGGGGADAFNFAGGSVSGVVEGDAGQDVLSFESLATAVSVTLSGAPGADGFGGSVTGGAAANFADVGEIAGSMATSDSFSGLDAAATWTLGSSGNRYAAADSMMMQRTLNLGGFEALNGGTMADAFVFDVSDASAVSGTVDGGMGADMLDLSRLTTATAVSLSGMPTAGGFGGSLAGGMGASFTNIDNIAGGMAASDSLSGLDTVATWTLSSTGNRYAAPDSGSPPVTRTLAFSGIENLDGGAMVDTFTVSGAHTGNLAGGTGADVFNLDAILTGGIKAGADADRFVLGAAGSASGTLDGEQGADMLQGRDAASTWQILSTGNNYVSGTLTQSFSSVEDLQGGTGVDQFVAKDAHSGNLMGGGGNDIFTLEAELTGSLSGEAGTDVLDLAALTSAISVTLSGMPDADGFGGNAMPMAGMEVLFSGMDDLRGGPGTDSLIGLNAAATWTVGAVDRYQITDSSGGMSVTRTLAFSDMENLNGGTQADTFNLSAAHTGSLSGGDGADVFNLNAILGGMVSGGDGTDRIVLGASAGVSGKIAGGMGTDTLQGRNADATWTLSSGDDDIYSVAGMDALTQSFNGIENLQGGSMADIFVAGAAHTGDLMGGDGADVFTLTAALTGSLLGEGGADVFHLNSNGSVNDDIQGGAGADVFNLNAVYSSNTLEGNAGNDRFVIGASGAAASLDGGADTDTLQSRDAVATWTLSAASVGYEVGGVAQPLPAFSNMEVLRGGAMADTFMVSGARSFSLEGGGGADVFTLTAALTGSLSGEGGADTFNLNMGGSVSGGIAGGMEADTFDFNGGTVAGTVAGGAGADVLDFAGLTSAVSVTLSGTPSADGFDGSVAGGATVSGFTDIGEL